jgi:hypothetical protein
MGKSGLEVLSFVKDLGKGEVRDRRQEAFIGRITIEGARLPAAGCAGSRPSEARDWKWSR